ncbi:MAG: ribonuclease P protein subunit [Thaumarchaeota archaeon]|nr:ribonuclease P protein subunit [Nitrososphaerota archaeon]
MNVLGETLTVIDSTDPTKKGITGKVLLESAKTLLMDAKGRTLRVEKAGTMFQVAGSSEVVSGSEIMGRLQDRWGRSK